MCQYLTSRPSSTLIYSRSNLYSHSADTNLAPDLPSLVRIIASAKACSISPSVQHGLMITMASTQLAADTGLAIVLTVILHRHKTAFKSCVSPISAARRVVPDITAQHECHDQQSYAVRSEPWHCYSVCTSLVAVRSTSDSVSAAPPPRLSFSRYEIPPYSLMCQ